LESGGSRSTATGTNGGLPEERGQNFPVNWDTISHEPVNLLTEIEDFVLDHRPHGPLTADATEPRWNDYLLTVACPCGVVFGRWSRRRMLRWTCFG